MNKDLKEMRKQATWISVRKSIPGRENSHCKGSEEKLCIQWGGKEENREKGKREGKNGEEWGKKKLGSKLLCLVGIRKYLIFYLKEIESH